MRAISPSLCLLVLVVALALDGSTPSPASQHVSQASALIVHHTTGSTVTPVPGLNAKAKANPVRLLIPAIGVNAPIEAVGVTSAGELAIPTQNPWEHVGWYKSGPRPGERGSSVIDGHLNRPGGYPAVFWRLRDLHVGDQVMAIDVSGKTFRFRVIRTALYSPQDAPIQEIFGDESGTYLNLITCAGDWIPSQHQTNLRLVIYTSLE